MAFSFYRQYRLVIVMPSPRLYVKEKFALERDGLMADADRVPRRDRLAAVSGLSEPTRRALYAQVVAAGDWVSRDEAADAVGIERATAAHHLDRLADDGLLEIDYQRRSGRRGPGAGRPAKLYRRARRDFDVSLPPREYQLAGRLLADAVVRSRAEGTDVVVALDDAAREHGRHLAQEVRSRAHGGQSATACRRAVLETLQEHGYEPQTAADGTVLMRNCPFHDLAQAHTDLVCGMNVALVQAAIGDVDAAGYEARLEPGVDRCCVTLHPTAGEQ
jgi:predicted ArsR family transcriptional regulator